MLFIEQKAQTTKVPLVVIRPSIIAASFAEPVPGWTDSIGLLGGFYTIAGHGILRDLPLNPKLIGDQIPVDFVSNQLLVSIPFLVKQFRETNNPLLITHSCSSSTNGLTWGDTTSILVKHWERDPYEKAVMKPVMRAHTTDKSWQLAFKLNSEIPSKALYYISKVGNKKMKSDAKEFRECVKKCKEIGLQFAYFMNNEWIFDNPSTIKLA